MRLFFSFYVALATNSRKPSHTTYFEFVLMAYRCSASHCSSTRGDLNVSFFTFPAEETRLVQWLKYCPSNFVPKKSSALCNLHFSEKEVQLTPRKKSFRRPNRLLDPLPLLAKSYLQPEPQLGIQSDFFMVSVGRRGSFYYVLFYWLYWQLLILSNRNSCWFTTVVMYTSGRCLFVTATARWIIVRG